MNVGQIQNILIRFCCDCNVQVSWLSNFLKMVQQGPAGGKEVKAAGVHKADCAVQIPDTVG